MQGQIDGDFVESLLGRLFKVPSAEASRTFTLNPIRYCTADAQCRWP
jgi:hypothetical protein